MTESFGTSGPPRSILLATDLSSRGDRAIDRTAQLAREWDAEVHVVHAVDAAPSAPPAGVNAAIYLRSRPDPKSEAMRQLRRLVGDRAARLHIEDGPATQAILSAAEREGCDFIVLGEARDRLAGPLESTMDQVGRKAGVSVLVVRNRPAGPYRQLLVGTDYTEEASQALVKAASLFPEARLTLMHAYQVPYAGLLGDTPSDQDWAVQQRAKLQAHLDAAPLPMERKTSVRLQVEAGPVAAVLKHCILESDTDLTVIGAYPRGMLYDTVLGSARLIVDAVPGDVLIVRALRQPTK